MSKANYLAFPVSDLILILLARSLSAVGKVLHGALSKGIQTDSFVRLANMHGCKLQRQGPLVVVEAPEEVLGKRHSMELRIKSTDFAVYSSGVFGLDYRALFDLVRARENSIGFIVDAGANIGSTSLLFSIKFPGAEIWSIEADSSNFQRLASNMKRNGCDRVSCHHAALWGRRESLVVSQRSEHWGRQVTAGETGTVGKAESVSSMTMEDIVASAPAGRIDILKMDIEGAEASVFCDGELDANGWLQKVRFLAIEIHGHDLEMRIKENLHRAGFFVFRTGETTYAQNLNFPDHGLMPVRSA